MEKQKFDEMEDYLRIAKEMNANNGLHAFLVVYHEIALDGRITVNKEVYVCPSFSHICAMYDHPEQGRAVLDVKYMGVGKVSLKGLVQKPVADISEVKHGTKGGV